MTMDNMDFDVDQLGDEFVDVTLIGTEEQPEECAQGIPPVVQVRFRDLVQTVDSADIMNDMFKLDISFTVEVFCTEQNKFIDSGVVTKKIKFSKQALAAEVISKTAATPITEADISTSVLSVSKTLNEGSTDVALKTMKRLRELAGIPSSGNWV